MRLSLSYCCFQVAIELGVAYLMTYCNLVLHFVQCPLLMKQITAKLNVYFNKTKTSSSAKVEQQLRPSTSSSCVSEPSTSVSATSRLDPTNGQQVTPQPSAMAEPVTFPIAAPMPGALQPHQQLNPFMYPPPSYYSHVQSNAPNWTNFHCTPGSLVNPGACMPTATTYYPGIRPPPSMAYMNPVAAVPYHLPPPPLPLRAPTSTAMAVPVTGTTNCGAADGANGSGMDLMQTFINRTHTL